jgi:hypothetical protein
MDGSDRKTWFRITLHPALSLGQRRGTLRRPGGPLLRRR